MGLLERRRGSIRFAGRDTIRLQPRRIARLGIGFCPEERGIFASLTSRRTWCCRRWFGPAV